MMGVWHWFYQMRIGSVLAEHFSGDYSGKMQRRAIPAEKADDFCGGRVSG